MKRLVQLTLPLLLCFSVTGCAYFSQNNGKPKNEACVALKRQMVFNSRSNSADARFVAASQQTDLKERYDEYGCA